MTVATLWGSLGTGETLWEDLGTGGTLWRSLGIVGTLWKGLGTGFRGRQWMGVGAHEEQQ